MRGLIQRSIHNALLVIVAGCLAYAGNGQSAQGAEPSESIAIFNGKDLAGWRLHGDPNKSFWKVGTAAIDPKDPTKLVVLPGGSDLINADRHGIDLL